MPNFLAEVLKKAPADLSLEALLHAQVEAKATDSLSDALREYFSVGYLYQRCHNILQKLMHS